MAFAKRRMLDTGGARFTGVYLDPAGRERSAGTYDSKRLALREARAAEAAIEAGDWIDPSHGKITFRKYVEQHWWPSRHLELSTKASYRSYLDKHFLPFFGEMPMRTILPSAVQAWVTQAVASGLSARSVVKYHVMLHSVFKRAVRDRVILHNPARETELPKVVSQRVRILTPEEFSRVLDELPTRYVPMVLTDIETGLRWGELIALRPTDIDFLRRTMTVHRVIIEVSRKVSPAGERMVVKHYPKDDEPRTLRISSDLVETLSRQVASLGLAPEQLLFSSTGRADGNPISRNWGCPGLTDALASSAPLSERVAPVRRTARER
ncbi:MAG: tyrosine-type recombinase/integrase [Mycobacteriales bacterium]